MKPLTALLAAASLFVASVTQAQDKAPAKPAGATVKSAKPSARGPGTQTEDELYIGAKAKTPLKARARPSARAKTGDEDLDDLEVQRAKPNSR
ncbi:MAG: hypothetical protein ABT20_18230 [Rubrivivax sp. SCN 70-15]|nr:MAG: hypothetical protein ABT20_18230 [Rubrivivax sp. SCN 70-15]